MREKKEKEKEKGRKKENLQSFKLNIPSLINVL